MFFRLLKVNIIFQAFYINNINHVIKVKFFKFHTCFQFLREKHITTIKQSNFIVLYNNGK